MGWFRFRAAGGQNQAQDLGHDSGATGNTHFDRDQAQKGLDGVLADPHMLSHFLVAESLQEQCHRCLLSMGKAELLRDLGQGKRSRHPSLQHNQDGRAVGTFAIAVQKKHAAEIGPASRLELYDGMSPIPSCRRALSTENSGRYLFVKCVGEALWRRPRIGQNRSRFVVGKKGPRRRISYQETQYGWPACKFTAVS